MGDAHMGIAEPPVGESVIRTGSPVVFSGFGLAPNCRIQVLNKIYHCHSMILKLHSNFFRNHLEAYRSRPFAQFQYECVSVVGRDGHCTIQPLEVVSYIGYNPILRS